MAQTIPCDICEQEPAVMLVTMIQTGDSQGVGILCVAMWARLLAETVDVQNGVSDPSATEPDGDPALLVTANPGAFQSPDGDPGAATGAVPPGKPPLKRAPRKATAAAKR